MELLVNALKSRTTQNVGGASAIVLVLNAAIQHYLPVSEAITPEIQGAITVLIIAVVTALASRGLAFLRTPAKKTKGE